MITYLATKIDADNAETLYEGDSHDAALAELPADLVFDLDRPTTDVRPVKGMRYTRAAATISGVTFSLIRIYRDF